MTQEISPELDIDLGTDDGNAGERRRIIEDVFSDYKKVLRAAIEDDWQFKNNKTFSWGKIDESHLTHAMHGGQVLFTLFRHLPEDHFFVDEQMFRETLSMYFVHDYHKIRSDERGDEDFDISKTEARLFKEKLNIGVLSDVDIEAIRGTLAAHHVTDEDAKKNEIPFEYLDEFLFVLLADGLASSEDAEDAQSSSCRKRLHKALGKGYSGFSHEIARDMGEFSGVVNRSVKELLSEMGFIPLKPYSDGCLYVKTPESELNTDNINERLMERVRENMANARDDYALDETYTEPIELKDFKKGYYTIGFENILFQGLEGSIKGVIRQAVADSAKTEPNDTAEKNETFAVTQPAKKRIDAVEEFTDVDIHTETRRVEGLARGIHTIHRQITSKITQDVETETMPEWKYDDLMATLKLFGLYNDIDAREELKEIREKSEDDLMAGTSHWDYKFIVGQFVYEKYCDGLRPEKLSEMLTDIVLDNLKMYVESVDEFEEYLVGDITSEIASWLGINVLLHENSDSEMKLAEYREEDELVTPYISNYDKSDCAVCGWGTTATKWENLILEKWQDRDDKTTEDIEVNINGAGEREFVSVDEDKSICYACQLRVSLNRGNNEHYGSDGEVVYAHIQDEYGYNPLSAWFFTAVRNELMDDNDETLSIENVKQEIVNSDVISPVERVLSWDTSDMIESLTSVDGAYKPRTPYCSSAIPIAVDIDERDWKEVREAITATVAMCAYSGLRVNLSFSPISKVTYNTGQMVSFTDKFTKLFPGYEDNHITLKYARGFLLEEATKDGEFEWEIETENPVTQSI